MSQNFSFQLWSHLEERFCQTGETPASTDSNETIFRSIVRANNARSSEALVIQGKADPLLALRAYVYRGRFKEATELAKNLMDGAGSSIRTAEIFLEQARLLGLDGEWAKCEEACSFALELPEIAPVSQLTLFQMRALSRFETHQMTAAISDLERIDSLASIFPNSPSAFYAAILRTKIVALDRGVDAGIQLLRRLWTQFANDPNSNLDRVHALIRAEVYLDFCLDQVSPGRLLASYRIAEITGERLYLALAALEGMHSRVPSLVSYFSPMVKETARDFPKIRKLLAELEESTDERSVSGTMLVQASQSPKIIGTVVDGDLGPWMARISNLLFASQGFVVHLEPYAMLNLNAQPQLKKALLTLSEGPISMSSFFSKLWGRQRYSYELHANLISSLLYRLRKKTGISAKIISGEIHLENTLVLP